MGYTANSSLVPPVQLSQSDIRHFICKQNNQCASGPSLSLRSPPWCGWAPVSITRRRHAADSGRRPKLVSAPIGRPAPTAHQTRYDQRAIGAPRQPSVAAPRGTPPPPRRWQAAPANAVRPSGAGAGICRGGSEPTGWRLERVIRFRTPLDGVRGRVAVRDLSDRVCSEQGSLGQSLLRAGISRTESLQSRDLSDRVCSDRAADRADRVCLVL